MSLKDVIEALEKDRNPGLREDIARLSASLVALSNRQSEDIFLLNQTIDALKSGVRPGDLQLIDTLERLRIREERQLEEIDGLRKLF